MPQLTWIGKDKVKNHHHDIPFHLLKKEYDFKANNGKPENSQNNMLIQGDNLLALKSLLPKYEGKINCIYIDPPYNTGNEKWVYNDNVNDPRIKKWLGEVVGKEGEDLSRHDKWLCMMYPRLKLLHRLLADDGVIFISIDDNEFAHLKLICDEIFRPVNRITSISVINNPKGRSDEKDIATAHEYLIIYKKSDDIYLSGFDAEEKITKRYNRIDKDGFKWREIDLRKTGDNDLKEDRPNMFYPFFYDKDKNILSLDEFPNAIEILPMKDSTTEGCWRWGKDTSKENIKNLYARYMPNKKQWSIFEKDYFDVSEKIKSTSIWDFKDVNSERGTEIFVKELKFDKNDFPKPKPIGTIERALQLATNKNSIILDSFIGSGTTAHAVLNLNARDGGNRQFIGIEMMDYAENITAERIRRVINGYGSKSETQQGTGGGFSFYTIGETLFDKEGNLNDRADLQSIREYIAHSEKLETVFNQEISGYFLGKNYQTAYIFYYEANQITTLSLEFLRHLNSDFLSKKTQDYIIYADKCTLSDEQLAQFKIRFKRIPRDISKL